MSFYVLSKRQSIVVQEISLDVSVCQRSASEDENDQDDDPNGNAGASGPAIGGTNNGK